jgi:TPR repeat protein
MTNVGKGDEVEAETKALIAKAEQGVASAQRNLGLMYYNGQGVLKDDVNAYAWFNVASANGAKNGSNSREMVAKEMNPEQIAEAQKLLKVWFEKFQPKK